MTISRPQAITDHHTALLALLYMRQSSEKQVRENIGSAELQRELVEVLVAWGWPRERIIVLDTDLGVSASVPNQRGGFEWLIREVNGDRVGIVMVADDDRFSRNRPDFSRFNDAAAIHDCLYAIGTQVYDYNDPDGEYGATVSHADTVRASRKLFRKLRDSRVRKAKAGRSVSAPPVGYIRLPNGDYEKIADLQAREVIGLLFDRIFALRSGRSLVRELRHRGIKVPRKGRGGQLRWVEATWSILSLFFHNEAYAGVYVYRKTLVDPRAPRLKNGHHGVRRAAAGETIRIENHHESYIEPHRWPELQELLKRNLKERNSNLPRKKGEALLRGHLRCTAHNVTLTTTYPHHRERLPDGQRVRGARYRCLRVFQERCENGACLSLRGRWIDAAIEAEVLRALSSPSTDMLKATARHALGEYEATCRARTTTIHRAQQTASELEREYLQVPSEHAHRKQRLGDLWNAALRDLEAITDEHRRNPLVPPFELGDVELEELKTITGDLPSLWRHSLVTASQRKLIVGLVIRAIYVTATEYTMNWVIDWVSGEKTHKKVLNRKGIDRLVDRRTRQGRSLVEIADELNRRGAGHHKSFRPFTPAMVRKVVARLGTKPPRDLTPYHYMHRHYLEGAAHQDIVDGLNREGIGHPLGSWTESRERTAFRQLRRGVVPGLPPLPKTRSPWEVASERDKALRTLWIEMPDHRIVTQRANELGILTWRGRPWNTTEMARKLFALGLRTRKRRGPYKKRADRDNEGA